MNSVVSLPYLSIGSDEGLQPQIFQRHFIEFFEFVSHSIWSSEGWDLDIEFLLMGNLGDWQPHYQGLKCEDSITVTSARVDLACLLVECSLLSSVLHMGPLEGE